MCVLYVCVMCVLCVMRMFRFFGCGVLSLNACTLTCLTCVGMCWPPNRVLVVDLPVSAHDLVQADLQTYHTLWKAGFGGHRDIESLARMTTDSAVLKTFVARPSEDLKAALLANSLSEFWKSPRADGRTRGLCVRDAAFSVHGGVSVLSAGDAGKDQPGYQCRNASLLRGFVDHMISRYPVGVPAPLANNNLRIAYAE